MPPRRDYRDRACDIDHGGHEAHRAARRSRMAAGVAALGDDHVDAEAHGLFGFSQRLHLADGLGAGVADLRHVRCGIAERQHDRCRLGLERGAQGLGLGIERPGDEAHADACVAGGQKLARDGGGVGIARADQAEAARVGDGGGKLAAGRRAHRRQKDRMGDAERARQRGFDPGHDCSPYISA